MTDVLTRSYGNDRAGVNSRETILTAAAVGTRGIRLLYSLPITDDARGAEAQVLCVSAVKGSDGKTRDLIIVASLGNSITAFDHADGAKVWSTSLGPPIKSTKQIDTWGTNDHFGILSTPVIDPGAQMVYACCWVSPDGSVAKAQHYFAGVSLVNGSQPKPMINLEGADYDPGGVPVQKFSSSARKQRASLLLAKGVSQFGLLGTVFVPFGSIYESSSANRGWVLAIDIAQWRITAALATAANGSGGGIWQAGSGLAMDAAGSIYAMTGNGDFDGELNWGESFIKLRYTRPGPALRGTIQVVDHWTPFLDRVRAAGVAGVEEDETAVIPDTTVVRRAAVTDPSRFDASGNIPLNPGEVWDMDLGSGGPTLIPDLGSLIGSGKDGILFPVRMHAMGQTSPGQLETAAGTEANYRQLAGHPIWLTFYPGPGPSPMPTDPRALNVNYWGQTHHQHGSLIAWKSPQGHRMLCWGENSYLRLWGLAPLPTDDPKKPNLAVTFLATGQELASPRAPVPPGGMPGAMMSLSYDSAHPNNSAVLWACVPYGDANKGDHETGVTPGRFLTYDMNQFKEGPTGAVIPVLWDSSNWGPEHGFNFCKFTPPVVYKGKVYVPTFSEKINVYGLA